MVVEGEALEWVPRLAGQPEATLQGLAPPRAAEPVAQLGQERHSVPRRAAELAGVGSALPPCRQVAALALAAERVPRSASQPGRAFPREMSFQPGPPMPSTAL